MQKLSHLLLLREALGPVTKSMMFQYFRGIYDHFESLSESGRKGFGLDLARSQIFVVGELMGRCKCFQERLGAFLNMTSLRNSDRGGYSVIVTRDETHCGSLWATRRMKLKVQCE